jgi:hypothetical protein
MNGGAAEEPSYDGYELLHDELMDQISVSIQDSNFGDSTSRISLKFPCDDESNKKMKISLSQEQLKLNTSKNFLTVPASTRKQRSLSFSAADIRPSRRAVKIFTASDLTDLQERSRTQPVDNDVNEIIYAVPQKQFSHRLLDGGGGIKTSSASLSTGGGGGESSKSVIANVASTNSLHSNTDFKYPLAFYCKICNKLLDDPRVLDCLHTFCCQCLAQLDATNNLQNNQFWRKISDASSGKLSGPGWDLSCFWR